ncbi:MAG: low specificity L-threonine aldolase [Gammaproteobacteria bacterium]|nr:low specificity L-threonine aldolase [Gammaproteobacteria bacterium]
MVGFVSDNVSAIHPRIMEALQRENEGVRMPYGNDGLSAQLNERFSQVFETPVDVIPCTTGTAANSLALSLMAGPINSIGVHERSHVYADECNAPEFYSGARLAPLAGADCKVELAELAELTTLIGEAHSPQPAALSLTQTTEVGTVYSIQEVQKLAEMAQVKKMFVHMDGARFANAVAALDCSPADISWRAGIDALSFGGTKNGCMAAEAVVIFNRKLLPTAAHRQKRAGQLLSKNRFMAAQLLAYTEDDLWLQTARHANARMSELAAGLANIEGVQLPSEIASNMMFARFTEAQNRALKNAGLAGYLFDSGEMRLVCSWATSKEDVDQFIACVSGA